MALPGYFFSCGADEPRPLVVAHNGFDGTGEEIWSMVGRAGQERGYHVLAFEGPGQGQVIRELGLPFRPDWERVVGPVLDVAAARPDVRADRIGLLRISMGGVLAPRAAAFDDRIAAVVAFDGVYDMATVPLDYVLRTPPGAVCWFSEHGRWVMGAHHPRALRALGRLHRRVRATKAAIRIRIARSVKWARRLVSMALQGGMEACEGLTDQQPATLVYLTGSSSFARTSTRRRRNTVGWRHRPCSQQMSASTSTTSWGSARV